MVAADLGAELGSVRPPCDTAGHGKNRPHGLLLGKGWSPKAGTVGSRDPEQIKASWQGDCSAMIGIVAAVSPLSRVLVIDIDTKPGKPNGWESIFHLMEECGPLPETTSVITPRPYAARLDHDVAAGDGKAAYLEGFRCRLR
jgi:hypothetical protein